MPADIRSFFGGKPPASSAEAPKPAEAKKRGRSRKVVEDDEDDDDVEVVKSRKSTPKEKQAKPEPEPEETSARDFFGHGNKPKRSEAVRAAPKAKTSATNTPKKANGSKKSTPKQTPNGRTSTRAKKETTYIDLDEDDFPDDFAEEDAEDNFQADAKVGRRKGDDYDEGSGADDDLPLKPQKQRKSKADDDFDPDGDVDMNGDHEDDAFVISDDDKKPAKTKSTKPSKKRKSAALDDEDDDDLEVEEAKPKKKRATTTPKKTAAPKKPKDQPEDTAEAKAIFDSIPLIKAPSPPKDGDASKPKFQFGQHKNSQAPAGALDPSDMPRGAENCLAGLTFVFTGQLQRLGREAGQAMVKEYGGKVTTAPSAKTSYVVLGEDAGPKKLETIKKNNLKVINEDGLFALIQQLPANGGSSVAAEKQAEKRAKEDEKIRQAAEEMEKEEQERKRAAAAAAKLKAKSTGNASASTSQPSQGQGKAAVKPENSLWTVRYAPTKIEQICGNTGQVQKLQKWLRNFPNNMKTGFKKGGPDGSGTYRAVMIHGPPGIGKTTAAHLVAKLEGYDVVESNASDTRSKKLVENSLKGVLSTTSLMGYFAAGSDSVEASKKKVVLIMDEVDGMSAGDRGGVGALATVAKKTQIPMILICNERRQPKMKPFDFVTYDLGFRRPTTDQIRSRIMTIAYREGLKMPPNVIGALIEGSGADIRQVVNMISTVKLDSETLSFDSSRDMCKAWEKHLVLKPWDMVNRIMAPEIWNPASKATLNTKQELYFNDHDFAPLMLQENYLGPKPQRCNKYNDPQKRKMAHLSLISKAADAISDGDLVDRMIHGSQQQWSLMPVHAMFSFVRPASFVHGTLAGTKTEFASWLGKNSNQNKLTRYVKEIQSHMRLRVSADRHEIRQTYMPLLFERLIRRLEKDGKDSVPDVMELMDYYYLTKDDWDAILELGVGGSNMDTVKIDTQSKASFTRLYNQQQHPMPFMKASSVLAPKKAPAKERPDLEEAFEESDEGEAVDEADVKDEDDDISKDKYVKQPKKRKAAGAGAKAGGSKKRKADSDDETPDTSKPAKATKGKGRAKN